MIHDINTRPPTIFLIRFFFYGVLLSLFIGLLNNQWELTLLGVLVVTMIMGVKLWGRLSLHKVSFSPTVTTPRVFPGEAIQIKARLENAKPLPIWIKLRVSVDRGLQSRFPEHYLSTDTWVLGYQEVTLAFDLTVPRRGVHRVGPFEVRGGDLLGFFSRGRNCPQTFQVVVFPRIRPIRRVAIPRREIFGVPGAKHPVEDPIYLLGTRDYQHRRPAKYIHWKASARLNRLQEKICEPSSQEKVLIMVEVASFEKNEAAQAFEDTLEVAASLVVQLNQQGIATGFLTNGEIVDQHPAMISPGRGPHQLPRILETMARLKMSKAAGMEDLLSGRIRSTSGLSYALFIHSPTMDTFGCEGVLKQMKVPGVRLVYHSGDPDLDSEELVTAPLSIGDICLPRVRRNDE